MPIKLIFLILLGLFFYQHSLAQGNFTGSNLFEFQLGNLPDLEPKDQFSFYDQLNLSYRYKKFNFQTRIEQYYPSFGSDNTYFRFSQVRAEYKSRKLDVQVGNLYTSFGRGLLLRMYDIPGSIWETRGYRVRYSFFRDMLGASVKLNLKKLEMKVLGGKVLDVTLPPTLGYVNARRPDLAMGSEVSYRIKRQKIGLMYMANQTKNISSGDGSSKNTYHYTSLNYDGRLGKNLQAYAELARQIESGSGFFNYSDKAAYAAYIGLNYYQNNLGVSMEYKNYHNFFIGTGINDPPTLVKEQNYKLLNRSTHVPIPTDESGYQVEAYYNLPNRNMITFNSAMAKNEIVEGSPTYFLEFFGEYLFYIKDKTEGRLFVDYSQDPIINEIHRYATGSNLAIIHEKLSSNIDLEWQMIKRSTRFDVVFSNWLFSYTLSKASKFSATVLVEVTGDPILLEGNKNYNFYPSTSFSYHITRKNIATLFVGKRRGGPACNSGVCYDVLDFEGLELRLSTRF